MNVPFTNRISEKTQRLMLTQIKEHALNEPEGKYLRLTVIGDPQTLTLVPLGDLRDDLNLVYDPGGDPSTINIFSNRTAYICKTEKELLDTLEFLLEHLNLFEKSDTDPYDCDDKIKHFDERSYGGKEDAEDTLAK